jgi:hypothetical protein
MHCLALDARRPAQLGAMDSPAEPPRRVARRTERHGVFFGRGCLREALSECAGTRRWRG